MNDLRQRVPGHSLIDELLRQWDQGTIRIDEQSNHVVIDDEAVAWYRGVIGERAIAHTLSQLGPEWTVLHSVPIGKGTTDVDHVVIGQPGVFTINTKYSPGKAVWAKGRGMFVGGHKQPYVMNILREASKSAELLSAAVGSTIPVTGLIVFVDPARMDRKYPIGGDTYDPEVRVLAQDELLGALTGRAVFSAEQVAAVVRAAVQPRTWHRSPHESTVGAHIALEFEALYAELEPRLHLARPSSPSSGPRAPIKRTQTRAAAPRSRQARRKPRRSLAERLFSQFALPIIGIVFLLVWMNNLTHH